MLHLLPASVKPAQVRCALTQVFQNQLKHKDNFTPEGWLRVGFAGKQLKISEYYINTGSLYLCSVGLLALGLPATDEFWLAPDEEWTSRKAWNGDDVQADHSL